MKDQGITLIELVVVMAVAGALITVLVFDYRGWTRRYSVERTTKELYADMMHARLTAVSKNREHYVVLGEGSYSVVEDTNDSGDYDGGDAPLPAYPKRVLCRLDWNNKDAVSKISFDKRGFVSGLRTIWVVPTADAEFSCIKVSMSRIVMGKYREDENDCKVK
jgi:prepilin-type N-terminal cleavage/methylation domain-containing protein